MKQSGHLNPSEENGTGCPVTSKYGRTPPNRHRVVGRKQQTTSCLVQPIVAHCCEVMYFGCSDFRGELGYLNWDDVCMCVVNKQFELLEFVFESVYVDLQYDQISLTFTAGSVFLCRFCSSVVVLGLSVRLSWYPMLWIRLLR